MLKKTVNKAKAVAKRAVVSARKAVAKAKKLSKKYHAQKLSYSEAEDFTSAATIH